MQDISADILLKAQEGDIEAFECLYRVSSGFVFTVALGITNNRADAEEVTQDVFIKVYHSLRSFRFASTFKTWVYRITVNTALNVYRKKVKDARARGEFEAAMDVEDPHGPLEQSVEQEHSEKKLAGLLHCLNADQRTCLLLREVEGLSYQEIADILGTNINTVRSRLKRAREAILKQKNEGDIV